MLLKHTGKTKRPITLELDHPEIPKLTLRSGGVRNSVPRSVTIRVGEVAEVPEEALKIPRVARKIKARQLKRILDVPAPKPAKKGKGKGKGKTSKASK